MGRVAVFRMIRWRRADATARAVDHAPSPAVDAPARDIPLRIAWSPPRGRDLLAGVAVLAVLVSILVVFTADVPAAPRTGGAEPFARAATAPAATAPAAWDDVPVALVPAALGPALAAPVGDGLADARGRVARCVALERRRAGRSAAEPAGEPARLVLRLAPRSGAVEVEGIEVRSPGSSPERLACARRHLDGDAMPAESAVPGRRHRLAVELR
jgi:hypothetical protein